MNRIVVVALIPASSHAFKAFLSILSIFLIRDGALTAKGYGLVVAIENFPSLIVPLIIGLRVKTIDDASFAIRVSLFLSTLSLLLCWISISSGHVNAFILSVFLFGCTSCMLSPLQRMLLKFQFQRHVTKASGIFIAVASASKITSKLLTVPMVILAGRYEDALLFPVFVSAVVATTFFLFEDFKDSTSTNIQSEESSKLKKHNGDSKVFHGFEADFGDVSTDNFMENTTIPVTTYWMIGVHTVYIVIFHAALNFLPYVAAQVWGISDRGTSFLASIPPLLAMVLCPIVGSLMNESRHQPLFCLIAGALTAFAYTTFLYENHLGVVVLILIALSQSVLFTILLAMIASHTPLKAIGWAYGLIEVLNAVANILGNIIFGMLCDIRPDCSFGFNFICILAWVGCAILLYLSWHYCTMISSLHRESYQRIHDAEDESKTFNNIKI